MLEQIYLRKRFRPDCDWIQGKLEARHGGFRSHSLTMSRVAIWFGVRRALLGVLPLIGPRILVAPQRYRVADVCVLKLPDTNGAIITSPPWVVVEVMSPKDRVVRLLQRSEDYLRMGVPNVWVIDPEARRAWTATRNGMIAASDDILRTADGLVIMPLAELFDEE